MFHVKHEKEAVKKACHSEPKAKNLSKMRQIQQFYKILRQINVPQDDTFDLLNSLSARYRLFLLCRSLCCGLFIWRCGRLLGGSFFSSR